MSTSMESEIRERLARYLGGETTLDEFYAWFVPATWDVERETDEGAFDTTNEIYLRLAEYSNGHRTEAELRPFLEALTGVPAISR